jgi:acetyl-CoA acetyltransferase
MNSLNRVAIAGVGYSETGRKLPYTDDQLVLQALTAAMGDAGMTPSDIDGVATMGGEAMRFGEVFGLNPLSYYFTSNMGPAFAEPAIQAISAIASGLCHTCIAFRLIRQAPGGMPSPEAAAAMLKGIAGDDQFIVPFGAMAAATGIGGIQMRRYMGEFGATEEQFAAHAIAQRYHASLNEDAILRDPLTLEDYLASRYVSDPVRLLDCDYPVDSSSAVIFTTAERARDWKQKPVMVESYALSSSEPDFWRLNDFVRSSPVHCSELLWSRTDLKPSDMDCAQLYDGFSVLVFQWLEALGFCGYGEAADFIADGHTRLGGSLPVNTDGGACNVGRRHGANFCIESVHQIRGQCGERQIADADASVWANSVGPFTGAVLLTA